ncbi:hypothetical protein E2562_030004 [Oryza meyeriana var. granulata]|uniref:Uncharacterized protein n=1 Tax=Oryza meyeriana var. granulata TaxID=110450 RepID=A0A6G1FDX0_9ORYZ|nr:hypothetical protein E2562_030004 [Oryza meyeriana var. granulata]
MGAVRVMRQDGAARLTGEGDILLGDVTFSLGSFDRAGAGRERDRRGRREEGDGSDARGLHIGETATGRSTDGWGLRS